MILSRSQIRDWYDEKEPLWLGRARRRLKNFRYWFLYRLHPTHRYHVVRTGLPPGYYDQELRMLYACMALLGDYIEECGGVAALEEFSAELRTMAAEKENFPGQHEYDLAQANRQDEALAIHRWWTIERPGDERRRDELSVEWRGSKHNGSRQEALKALDAKIAADEQAMLHRLIEIRPSLWT